ncbi:Hpt domain-containing protein [Holophaga foetida]|uniref:Hpt domain-containing protein n=1 Tax=Holophaga foetida TaxID=35839 RepID=UPI0002473783|nr:Hpt domain-containing protein [Holophaga foetida]
MAAELEANMDKNGKTCGDGLDSTTWEGLLYLETVAGPGAVAELVDAFIRDAAPRIAHLREALAGGDRPRIIKLAHDLKSNAATLGANRLSMQARRMEEFALELSAAELDALIGQAEEEVVLATRAIQARLQALHA